MRGVMLLMGAAALSAVFSACSKDGGDAPGEPVPDSALGRLRPQFDFRGRIFFQSDMDGDSEIYLLTAGGLTKLTDNSWQDEYPRVSPDGRRIAFSANPSGGFQLFTMNIDGTSVTQVTRAPHDASWQAWHPDGKRIAYSREAPGRDFTLWTLDLDTMKSEPLLPAFRGSLSLPDFSPTSPLMTFTGKRFLGWDVQMVDLASGRWQELARGGRSCRARFSPDGKKLAYVSSEADGKGDIWTMNPDGSDKKRLTARDDVYDYFPSWSPDGKYIVFCSDKAGRLQGGRWALFLVKVETGLIFPLFHSGRRDIFPEWY